MMQISSKTSLRASVSRTAISSPLPCAFKSTSARNTVLNATRNFYGFPGSSPGTTFTGGRVYTEAELKTPSGQIETATKAPVLPPRAAVKVSVPSSTATIKVSVPSSTAAAKASAVTAVPISTAAAKVSIPTRVPAKAPVSTPAFRKPSVPDLGDIMAFGGSGPEIINGRLAMLGFIAAAGAELSSGDSILRQLAVEPTGIVAILVLFMAGSLVPFMNGSKRTESLGPFSPTAEMINGRAAMIGFAAMLFIEATSGQALL